MLWALQLYIKDKLEVDNIQKWPIKLVSLQVYYLYVKLLSTLKRLDLIHIKFFKTFQLVLQVVGQ